MKKILVLLVAVFSLAICKAEVNKDSIVCLKFLGEKDVSGHEIQKYSAYEITKVDTIEKEIVYHFLYLNDKQLEVKLDDRISVDTISKEVLSLSEVLKESLKIKGSVLYASCPIAIGGGISVIVDDDLVFITESESKEIELPEETKEIEVALSDASKTFPNFIFHVSDLVVGAEAPNPNSVNVGVIIIGFLLLLILGIVFYFLLNRQIASIKQLLMKDEIVSENDNLKKENEEMKGKVESLKSQLKDFEDIKKQAGITQEWEDKYNKLDEAKKKADADLNDANKKLKELPVLRNKLGDALKWEEHYKVMKGEKEGKERELNNTKKLLDDEKIKSANWERKYEEALTIKDALRVDGIEKFVTNARDLLDKLVDGRQKVINFIYNLSSDDRHLLDYYIATFMYKVPLKEIERWAGIVEGLNINGYIKDPGYVKYLKGQKDEERESSLEKYFFEDLARPYVSPVLVTLEVLRTGNQMGLSSSYKEAGVIIEGIINSCYQLKIVVDYYRLFEPLKESQFKNIKTVNVPDFLKKVLPIETEKVLYVENYAVNSSFSNSTEETKISYTM